LGKTLVSSSLIDRVTADLDRPLAEVPVGFKWFVEGLKSGAYGIGLEESAGASFLRKDGTVWTTDKDGIIMDLLATEITARTGKDPGGLYQELTERFGRLRYERMDAPANQTAIGGLKVLTENGGFPARPSGTEDIYKIYTESFKGPEHLAQIQKKAQEMVRQAFEAAGRNPFS